MKFYMKIATVLVIIACTVALAFAAATPPSTTRIGSAFMINGRSTAPGSTTVNVLLYDTNAMVMLSYGETVPTDAEAGYAKGAIFLDTNVAAGTSGFYVNQGSITSCLFQAVSGTGTVGSITSAMILDGTIVAADIATGGVATAEILDLTIIAGDIATGAVTSAKILDSTIVAGDIATGAVTSAKILNGTIALVDMGTAAVNSTTIVNDSVTSGDIKDATIVGADILDGAIGTAKIANGVVGVVDLRNTYKLLQVGTGQKSNTITLDSASDLWFMPIPLANVSSVEHIINATGWGTTTITFTLQNATDDVSLWNVPVIRQ